MIKNLAKYDDINLYIIGETVEKRNIYAFVIGTGDKKINNNQIILLSLQLCSLQSINQARIRNESDDFFI